MRSTIAVLLVGTVASCTHGDPEPARGDEGVPCAASRACAEGLLCFLWEDSLEGSCLPEDCRWNGYNCDGTGGSG